ncbi:NIPSNAP family protein [Paenibacillus xerothermodurans]|uniref:NIPSNAP family protein n=1 Tax=Paenibacillus xerothermodurans TaxID=1977292 RepID=A0A2W1NSC4_PAEXE|nr:NIPSNAP family protein [Paenibacillus xerothermodurans]PZE21683.1 NIPSNAP family protein [Paenibacillus xerothermodurans]
MVYEMRTYTIKIGKLQAYLKHFEDVGIPIISNYAKLIGYWYTDIGELNQIVHIWEYETLDQRAERRTALYNDPIWVETFLPIAGPMLEKQESRIMYAANFSPIR